MSKAQDKIRAAKEAAARLANGPDKNPAAAAKHSMRADQLVAKLLESPEAPTRTA
jgi:hypothetical protein